MRKNRGSNGGTEPKKRKKDKTRLPLQVNLKTTHDGSNRGGAIILRGANVT